MSGSQASGERPPMDAFPTEEHEPRHHFILYHAGTTRQSSSAIVNTRRICETYLSGRYDLEIVDISKNPQRAIDAQIIAAPTLVRINPQPLRRFIGDMSRVTKIIRDLNLLDPEDEGGGL